MITTGGSVISILSMWTESRSVNRNIKVGKGYHPEDAKNLSSLAGQLVLLNVVNVITGAAAGLGASQFADGDRSLAPAGWPVAVFITAVVVAELTGIFIVRYSTRPTKAWVTDIGIFHAQLIQMSRLGEVGDDEIQEIKETGDEWKDKTIVRPLRSRSELSSLGFKLESADAEWATDGTDHRMRGGTPATSHGKASRALDQDKEKVAAWDTPGRIRVNLVATTIVLLWNYADSKFLLVSLSFAAALIWAAILYFLALPAARQI